MALSHVVNLGIGAPASVEHFITLGLEASVDVLLIGGETGFGYVPSTVSAASLSADLPSADPVLTADPAGTGSSFEVSPPAADAALAAGPPSSGSTYTYGS